MWWGFWFRADTVQKQQYIDVIVVLTQPRKVRLTSDLSTLSVQLLGSINTKSDQNQWQGFRYSTVFSLKQQFVVIIVNHDFRSFHTDLGSLWLYPIIVQKFEINRTTFHFSIICSLETFTNQRDRTFLARPICGRNTRENVYTCIQNVNIHTVKSVKSIRNILWHTVSGRIWKKRAFSGYANSATGWDKFRRSFLLNGSIKMFHTLG